MNDMLRIRSAKDYFEEYGREALYKQKADKKLVKQQLIDAFHKEIFGLVAMRAKKRFDDIPMEGDPEALRIASNVIKDETKKWKKLCDMLNYYAETCGCIQYSDLTLIPEEGNEEIGFKDGELVTRDILDGEPVEPDPYAAVEWQEQEDAEVDGYSEAEGDTDGDSAVIATSTYGESEGYVEAPPVTDWPFSTGYVDTREDIYPEDKPEHARET